MGVGLAFLVLVKILTFGVIDCLEFLFVNPQVYYSHNFPDLVPCMAPGPFAAFVSGISAARALAIVAVVYLIALDDINPLAYLAVQVFQSTCDVLDMALEKNARMRGFIPRNSGLHERFYIRGVAFEVLGLVAACLW
jgi:hypothetical protein